MGMGSGTKAAITDIRQKMAMMGIKDQLSITTFINGRAPQIQCTTDPVQALDMILDLLKAVAQALKPVPTNGQAEPVFEKREYLGPRDGVQVYDKGEG